MRVVTRLDQPDHWYLTAELAARLAVEHRTLVYLLAYGSLRWGEMAALRRGRIEVLRRCLEVKEAVAEISGRLSF